MKPKGIGGISMAGECSVRGEISELRDLISVTVVELPNDGVGTRRTRTAEVLFGDDVGLARGRRNSEEPDVEIGVGGDR